MDRRALQASAAKEAEYKIRMGQYTADQIVFVDESSVNESTGRRRWGWSDIGSRAIYNSPLLPAQRWTILPGLSLDGYICSRIVPEGFNGQQFLDFIKNDLLPVMQPFPAPRSVLVMDNCSIHHSEGVKLLCAEENVKLEFLPPYSPWLNPIEKTFSVLKSWLKAHEDEMEANIGNLGWFIEHAGQNAVTSDIAKAEFKACGWTV